MNLIKPSTPFYPNAQLPRFSQPQLQLRRNYIARRKSRPRKSVETAASLRRLRFQGGSRKRSGFPVAKSCANFLFCASPFFLLKVSGIHRDNKYISVMVENILSSFGKVFFIE